MRQKKDSRTASLSRITDPGINIDHVSLSARAECCLELPRYLVISGVFVVLASNEYT